MTKSWRVRDALHGFVELNEHESAIVNSEPYQRLRGVRQLGMAHYVYPGANHTRFEHCLGCVLITDRMYDRISSGGAKELWESTRGQANCDQLRQIVRFAALTHDLGHAPFSHTAEHLFQPPPGWENDSFSHESQTARLIRETEVAQIISNAGVDPEEVIAVATEFSESKLPKVEYRHDLHILNALITSEIGSDRCDYLVRDAYHSGQPAGTIDLDRLVQQVTLIEREGAIHFGILEGARLVAEQMIANRYAAYVDLYFHKTKRAYERHLIAFLTDWLDEGHFPHSLSDFLLLNDAAVEKGISEAAQSPDHPAYSHASRFMGRSHYRKAFERVPHDRKKVPPEKITQFEKNCEEYLQGSGFVDIVNHSGTKIRDHRILVEMGGRTRYLDTLAELISGINSRIWRLRVYTDDSRRKEIDAWCSTEWEKISAEGDKK